MTIKFIHEPWFPNWVINTVEAQNYLGHSEDFSFISSAFSWSKSPEGHQFWRDISDKYNRPVKTKDLQKLFKLLRKTNPEYFI